MYIEPLQSVVGNTVAFRVHAPCSASLLLDIFANAVTPQEYLTGEPMKFKSVCKFKIVCEDLQTVMVPLPDCASGEWGPAKATRLFGLIPLTHQESYSILTSMIVYSTMGIGNVQIKNTVSPPEMGMALWRVVVLTIDNIRFCGQWSQFRFIVLSQYIV